MELLPEDCMVEILSRVPPRLACRSSLVSAAVRDAVQSELLWDAFLPPDYPDILLRLLPPSSSSPTSPVRAFRSKKELFVKLLSPILIDGGRKTFWIDRESSKKCYALSARELSIAFSRNALYWCWKPLLGSRFPEIVELVMICWLEMTGKMKTRMLSPHTTYVAYFVFKLAGRAFGLDSLPSEVTIKVGSYESSKIAYLVRRKSDAKHALLEHVFLLNGMEILRSRHEEGRQECVVRERGDGWLEIELGEFYNDDGDKEVEMCVREVKGGHLKGGLIVEGFELRPK